MEVVLAMTASAGLSACQPQERATGSGPGGTFGAIAPDETIHLVGTEPFWGGEVAGKTLRYSTPDDARGVAIAVTRFAGNNGLGYSGSLRGRTLDLAITPGHCVDGMSDRRYPYVATLMIGSEQRDGCAWTDHDRFSEATR